MVAVHPNSRNVIPGRVKFSIDLRNASDELVAKMEASQYFDVIGGVSSFDELRRSLDTAQAAVALVIDPERDIDRYFEEAARHGLAIVAAVDTHIHADYLSGLREMAQRGVLVYASKEGGPDWQYEWLRGSSVAAR